MRTDPVPQAYTHLSGWLVICLILREKQYVCAAASEFRYGRLCLAHLQCRAASYRGRGEKNCFT